MKARNREVNIFNMSLLDILCGALGAFCFLMLALFPYYKPAHLSAEDRQTYQNAQQVQQRLQQLEESLRRQSANAGMTQQIQSALSQARQQIGLVQQQLDRSRAAMEQSDQRAAQAQTLANQLQAQVDMKHNLVVQEWYSGPKVDLFVHEAGTASKSNQAAPPFDPTKNQGNFFKSTQVLLGPGSQSWIMGETVPGPYVVYYRLDQASAATAPVPVIGAFDFESNFQNLPNITLSASRPYALVGTIVIDSKQKVTFTAAQQSPPAPGGPQQQQ